MAEGESNVYIDNVKISFNGTTVEGLDTSFEDITKDSLQKTWNVFGYGYDLLITDSDKYSGENSLVLKPN